jgi:D-alanine-D-alanine ligase
MTVALARRAGRALAAAFRHDPRRSSSVPAGAELTVGVLDDGAAGVDVRRARGLYDYRSKYTAGLTEYSRPRRSPCAGWARLGVLAVAAHRALGVAARARDFRLDGAGVRACLR